MRLENLLQLALEGRHSRENPTGQLLLLWLLLLLSGSDSGSGCCGGGGAGVGLCGLLLQLGQCGFMLSHQITLFELMQSNQFIFPLSS